MEEIISFLIEHQSNAVSSASLIVLFFLLKTDRKRISKIIDRAEASAELIQKYTSKTNDKLDRAAHDVQVAANKITTLKAETIYEIEKVMVYASKIERSLRQVEQALGSRLDELQDLRVDVDSLHKALGRVVDEQAEHRKSSARMKNGKA